MIESIRKRSPIAILVPAAAAATYVLVGPGSERALRIAMGAMTFAHLLALFFAIEAAYERKWGLFAFLVLVTMPAIGSTYARFLEHASGGRLTQYTADQSFSDFMPLLAGLIVLLFAIVIIVSIGNWRPPRRLS